MTQRLVIFLHLLKTGGTTIYGHVKNNLSDNKVAKNLPHKELFDKLFSKPKKDLDKVVFLQGHETYMGIHNRFTAKENIYFTVLRSPETRIISFYNYLVSLNGEEFDFDTWYYKTTKNYSINFLSKNQPIPRLLKLIPLSKFFITSNRIKYWQSKNVLNKCVLVSLTEQLDADLPLLFRLIGVKPEGWKNQYVSIDAQEIPKINKKSKFRIIYKRKKLTPQLRKKLLRDNYWDVKLYNYAQKIHSKKRQNLISYLNNNNL